MADTLPVLLESARIFTVRGATVILDSDLARLYEVETRRLNEAMGRNIGRFPEDFAFRLTAEEWRNLKSQFATSSSYGGKRKLPIVFTEHGVTMMAALLRSERAVAVSVLIVREFVRMRRETGDYAELSRRIESLREEMGEGFAQVWSVLSDLIASPASAPRRIGIRSE